MDFTDLHALLHATYGEMMPLCANMAGIAKVEYTLRITSEGITPVPFRE